MKRINLTHLAVAAALSGPMASLPALAGGLERLTKLDVTYPYWGGKSGGSAAGLFSYAAGAVAGNRVHIANIVLDFAAIAAARSAAGQAALGAADVLELIPVRAGTYVPVTAIEVTKVEGAACTMDLGDGATPAGYLSNVDANALTYVASLVTSSYSVAVGGGKLYTADDTIDLVLDSAGTDVAVVRVCALLVDLRSDLG